MSALLREKEFDAHAAASTLRLLSIDMVEAAASGHPGMPLGMADVAAVLWGKFLNISSAQPSWPDRDRFVLSAGHGSALLYSLLHLFGFPLQIDDLKRLRQLHSKTPGHPEYGHTEGVETTTGPLGQGVANGVGMALAESLLRHEYGPDLTNHWTYVICGDGCLMEGITHEAISVAGHLQLGRLIVFLDDNGITIDGPTSLSTSEDHHKRFEAAGWHVLALDGHDHEAITNAIHQARAETGKPSLLMCRTQIGFPSPNKAGSASVHGAPLGAEEAQKTRGVLGYPDLPAFEIPKNGRAAWERAALRAEQVQKNWQARFLHFQKQFPAQASSFQERLKNKLPQGWIDRLQETALPRLLSKERATRGHSGEVLDCLGALIPYLIGGSADLSGSNNTHSHHMRPVEAFSQNPQKHTGPFYVHYGVREHGMGGIMNGLALHKGLIPYGGTFLVFSDYMRPAIRLAALMKLPVVYVFTHDSIGLGEDGPTHQPIEHAASLRLIPHLWVFRPADGIEVAECWMLALDSSLRASHASQVCEGPSALLLSRQKVVTVRQKFDLAHTTARGGYVLSEANASHRLTILASGSEVGLAVDIKAQFEKEGVGVRVVSMPCLQLFDCQDDAYQAAVLSKELGIIRVSLEAGCTPLWKNYVGDSGLCLGVDDFGVSGKAESVFAYFSLTVAAIVTRIKDHMGMTRT